MTKYYLLITEVGISISQKVSAVPGYSLHESGEQRSVSAHLWQTQTLFSGLSSACHSGQPMGLTPRSPIQLSSSSDTTSPNTLLLEAVTQVQKQIRVLHGPGGGEEGLLLVQTVIHITGD